MAAERRADRRVPFINEVEIVGVGMRRSSDLSLGGIYLDTISSFPEGTLLFLRFRLRSGDESPIELKVRVLHNMPGLGLGLSFVDPPPETLEKIRDFIGRS